MWFILNFILKLDILFLIGPVAHLVEHVICNDGVAGSSPVGSTTKTPQGAFFVVDPKRVMGITRVRTRRPVIVFYKHCGVKNRAGVQNL